MKLDLLLSLLEYGNPSTSNMDKKMKNVVDEAVEAALNAGCKVIQDFVEEKNGDHAEHHFSGPETDKVREIFKTYLAAAIKEKSRSDVRFPGGEGESYGS